MDLSAILSAAEAGGARVVLMGDRRQLASVAGASALRAVNDVLGRHATLCRARASDQRASARACTAAAPATSSMQPCRA
jgi:hypothetical protein